MQKFNDADKLNEELSQYKDIPVVSYAAGVGQLLPGEDGSEDVNWGGGGAIESGKSLKLYLYFYPWRLQL